MWFNEKKIFVTGTDTGSGKTYVCAKIIEMYKKNGLNPAYFKPVATGGIFHDGHLISEDVLTIRNKTGIDLPFESMNPVLYEVPAAPFIASQISGIPLSLTKIKSAYSDISKKYDNIVVEGVGGILVPLTENYLVIDLVKELKLPVIVVSKPVLGTINHTLLTIKALKDFGIKILGIIVSYTEDKDPGISVTASFEVIKKITGLRIIKEFPYEMDWQ